MASSPSQFYHFPDLPIELRLQIWALAIPNRVLPITCTKGILSPSTRRYAKRFTTTSSPPPLLLTCRESRSVAHRHYASYFRTYSCPQGIYASFAHDVVSFPENTISYLGKEELEGIERMVLEVKDHAYFGCFNLNTLRDMRALRYLELRVENGLRYSWGTEGGAAPDILKDFRAEVVDWPDWQVPEIRIVEGTTGSELVVIRGRGDLVDEDSEV